MVQLRVDVEAANARAAFDNAARGVDNLSDQMRQAERESDRLGRAYTEAGQEVQRLGRQLGQAQNELNQFSAAAAAADREVDRLRAEIRRLGSGAPQQLRDDLRAAQANARALHGNVRDARQEVTRLGRETTVANEHLRQSAQAANHAGDEVRRLAAQLNLATLQANLLRHQMNRLDADANRATNRMQRGLLGFRQQVNQLLSQSPMSGLTSAVGAAWQAMPVEVKGFIVLAGIGMAATLAVAIGAAINGLLLAAVGAGVLAAGVMIAAKFSNIVQAAFADVFAPIGEEVKSFALGAMEGPLVKAAETFQDAWHRVSADVRSIFMEAGGWVEPLADGLSGLAREAMPGLRAAVAAAGPVIKELGRDLPMVGAALSDMFQSFADGDGAVKGLRATMMLLASTLIFVGNTVEFLSDEFDRFTEFMESFSSKLASIPVIGNLFEDAANKWRVFNEAGTGVARTLGATGDAAQSAAFDIYATGDAAQKAALAAQQLSDKLHGFISDALAADNAALAWEIALDGVTKAAKENGRTVDINTKKGQENVRAILDGVAAAEQKRQADIALAGGEHASAAAVDAANSAFRNQVGQLATLMRQLGFTEGQIQGVLGKYYQLANAPDINKSIKVTTYYRVVGRAVPVYNDFSSGIGGYASGTDSAPAGWAWVGEQGPELMRLRGGEQILSAQRSAKAATGGPAAPGGGMGVAVSLALSAGAGGGQDAVVSMFLQLLRTGALKLTAGGQRVAVA